MRTTNKLLTAAFVAASMLGGTFPAWAFQEGGDAGSGSEGGAEQPKEEEKDDDKVFAVINAEIHTGRGEVLRGATLVARNGRIRAIGHDVFVPPDAKVLDAAGMRVYPGLVAISSQGLLGGSTTEIEDTVDPFNSRMTLALSTGITTTGASSSAAKLNRFSIKDVLLNERALSTQSWSYRNPAGKRSLREKLAAASAWLRKYREWEEKVKKDKELKEPPKRGVDSTILSILKGETLAKFQANESDDLLGIARLAQEFGFRPVIEGCQEGWIVADELGRAGAYAIVTPRDRRPRDERQAAPGGTSPTNASVLHRAGVQIAVVPAQEGVDLGGIVGRDIMHLPIEAAFAVRGGLPEQAALESITIVPARILGVSHRVGSLEVGKDCDLIVTDGDVLHYQTFVQYAVVGGRLVYDKEKELFFAHIRPRPAAVAPETKIDKGETEPKPEEAKPEEDKADEKEGEKKEGEKEGGGEDKEDGG